jgi:ABC-type dipeptide/oligopeptide/nickel transport system permease subunit
MASDKIVNRGARIALGIVLIAEGIAGVVGGILGLISGV